MAGNSNNFQEIIEIIRKEENKKIQKICPLKSAKAADTGEAYSSVVSRITVDYILEGKIFNNFISALSSKEIF